MLLGNPGEPPKAELATHDVDMALLCGIPSHSKEAPPPSASSGHPFVSLYVTVWATEPFDRISLKVSPLL